VVAIGAVLRVVEGQYVHLESGVGLSRHDLLRRLEQGALQLPVKLRKETRGVYLVVNAEDGHPHYRLFSRRRERRQQEGQRSETRST
jgi:hypothetical protein